MQSYLILTALAGYALATFMLYYLTAFIVRLLAELNLFFTIVEEGAAKAVMVNDKFERFVMSFMGRDFTYTASGADNATMWDVDDTPAVKPHRGLPFFHGIHWLGFPPFAGVHTYKFVWSSLEEVPDEHGELVKRPVQTDKKIDYILLQSDIYVTRLETAECKDKIPLNANILIGGKVSNPYKALFRIERWLEAVENLIGARMREFFGTQTYEELVSHTGDGTSATELLTMFEDLIKEIRERYGFLITSIKISTVDPGSDLAQEFIRASTVRYVAEQQAAANEAEGKGLAARDTSHLTAISKIPGGQEMFKWQQLAKSGLTTYVEGGGAIPAISVGGGAASRPAPPDPTATTTP